MVGTDGVRPDWYTGPRPENSWSPPKRSYAQQWVHDNPIFISGLVLLGNNAPKSFVDDYYDNFHSTAAHYWEDGMPNREAGWAVHNHPKHRFVSWTKRDGTSHDNKKVIGGVGANHPGRIGYQIGDEPGLKDVGFNDILEFKTGVDAVRAVDPKALIIMNFSLKVKEIDKMLDYAGTTMKIDVFCYDRYKYSNGLYYDLEKCRSYAQKYKRPYWRYLTAYLKDSDFKITPTDIRWDAITGLVYGYTGHTWFLYNLDKIGGLVPAAYSTGGYNGQKTQLWSHFAAANKEMTVYGRAITKLASTDVRYIPSFPFLQPGATKNWQPGAGGDPYITAIKRPDSTLEVLAGFFRDDAGEFYVMLQNTRHKSGSFPVGSTAPGTIQVTFDFSKGAPDMGKKGLRVLDVKTESIKTVPLTKLTPVGGTIDFTLEAGAAVLFKYDTGRPFAGF